MFQQTALAYDARTNSQESDMGAVTAVSIPTSDASFRRNLVEVVRVSAFLIDASQETFALAELVSATRKIHGDHALTDALVASVLRDAGVEVDIATGTLRLCGRPR